MPASSSSRRAARSVATALVIQAYPLYIHRITPSISTTRSSPRGVGSSLSTAVSWVMVNTKTRSKNSSRVETRSAWPGCPSGRVTSNAGLGREAAGGHGGPQGLVVGLGLVGVGPGEPGEGPVGAVALAQVARQQGGPGGAGVALGQQGRPVHAVHGDGALHVAELAHVVVAPGHAGPAEQGVADRLQGLLVLDHPLALVGVPGGV